MFLQYFLLCIYLHCEITGNLSPTYKEKPSDSNVCFVTARVPESSSSACFLSYLSCSSRSHPHLSWMLFLPLYLFSIRRLVCLFSRDDKEIHMVIII